MTRAQLDRTDQAARARLEAALMRRRQGAATDGIRVLPRPAGELRFRAAVTQEGMWEGLAGGAGPAPAILAAVRLYGVLDVPLLEEAWNAVVARHETLRSSLRVEAGVLTQVVAPALRLPVEVIDAAAPEDFTAFVWEEGDRPFDLEHGPLARLKLLRLADDDHIVFLMVHHIIGDARTVEVVVRDLGAHYTAAQAGVPAPLEPLRVQFADFAAWHRERLDGPRGAELIAYWTERLAGAEPAVLPADLELPPVPSQRGTGVDVPMPDELYAAIRRLATERATTLYTVGLAAFTALLARRSGQRDICVRAPISFRDTSDVRDLVADFSNDVIVRTDLSADPTLGELLEQIKAGTAADFARHDLPPHLLEPHLPDPGLLARLFHVQFTAEEEFDTPDSLGDLRMEPLIPERQHVLRPLNIRLRHDAERAHCIVLYRTEQFTAGRIDELMREYHGLLAEMAHTPERRVFG
ncbi:condensation domain-containing protein [Streptomyces sp. NPDC056222]|uniref:condensation domain-containing protein n=1 Tax=Streptomyces sp. NPDC056222 TaxID=3345749 RepID=UPI0035DBEE13